MLGYDRDELVGHNVREFTHPEEQAAAAEAMRPVLAGETDSVAMERRYRHKQGHYVWTLTIASLIRDRDGQASSVVAVVQDITERRQAEEAHGAAVRGGGRPVQSEPLLHHLPGR